MLITRPPPRWRIAGNAARDMANVPMASISMTVLKPFTLISSAEACTTHQVLPSWPKIAQEAQKAAAMHQATIL